MDFEKGVWINSRKITKKSFTRHFAAWKRRFFKFDKKRNILHLESEVGSKNEIDLSSPSFEIKSHDYFDDNKFYLIAKFSDDLYLRDFEVVMKFETKQEKDIIFNFFLEAKRNSAICRYRTETKYYESLMNYLKENTKLKKNKERNGQFFDDNEENLDKLDIIKSGLLPSNDYLNQSNSSMDKVENFNKKKKAKYFHSKVVVSSNNLLSYWKIPVPKLRILIMAVGTRGDIQPFVQLGIQLKHDGHRVRISTHICFKDYIYSKGLEFYPLAGDPKKLSEFMVKTNGFIIPTTTEIMKEVPKYHRMLVDIMHSCWDACVKEDPYSEHKSPFLPDAIISNPITNAHIHCAEALGVPLHLMFPQPWVPTKAFPHPLSCLSYQQGWSIQNYISYQIIDELLWVSLERDINNLRTNILGLEPLRVGDSGWNLLNFHKVPFVKMWSPSFVPKPKDWPDYVDVVGTFFEFTPSTKLDNLKSEKEVSENEIYSQFGEIRNDSKQEFHSEIEINYEPSPELKVFLNTQKPIIFVGFGSMIFKDMEDKISLFLEAAAILELKIVIQIGWSEISKEKLVELAINAQKNALSVKVAEEGLSRFKSFDSDINLKQYLNDPSLEDSLVQSSIIHSEGFDSAYQSSLNDNYESTSLKGEPESLDQKNVQISKKGKKSLVGWVYDKLEKRFSYSEKLKKNETLSENMDDWNEVNNTNWDYERDAFFIGPCPHSWLFKQVSAVVHHGGAGTTAEGLRSGCPTWICPFFGGQYFWGEMVHKRNIGPVPCSVNSLNLEKVIDAFNYLQNKNVIKEAKLLSESILNENGVQKACEAFYRHLPIENMICEVSLFEDESILAQVYCHGCKMKMTKEKFDQIHNNSLYHIQDHYYSPCIYKNWTLPKPYNVNDGIISGLGGFVHEVREGMTDIIYDSFKGVYEDGIKGAAYGFLSGFQSLLKRPITGGNILYMKILDGMKKSIENKSIDSIDIQFSQDDSIMPAAESGVLENIKPNSPPTETFYFTRGRRVKIENENILINRNQLARYNCNSLHSINNQF